MNYLRNIMPALAFLLLYTAVDAQILNIEKARLSSDTSSNLIGNFSASFSLQRRNTQVISGQTNLNMNYSSDKHTYICIGNLHLINTEDANLVSDGYLHFRADFMKKRDLSYEGFVQSQYDLIRGMDYRHLVGSNLRLEIHNSDKSELTTGLGLMREWEAWTYEENTVTTELWKVNYYLALQMQLHANMSLNLGGYYQAVPSALGEPRIIGDANINFKVTKKFAITSKYSLIYDAAPVIPINKLVYTWLSGVAYRF